MINGTPINMSANICIRAAVSAAASAYSNSFLALAFPAAILAL
jgi:hypothetical protein